ncbi:MAG: carbohydrate ABC transporter permease [Chloroflexi bacterium]|jgi:alpha-1,4-digalacturonate transport system permease protein|nr:carbohydrate ABC transporter permease [Chloroflexota bacterium]
MSALKALRLRKGRTRLDITDVLSYLYLFAGVIVMFGPVVWLVLSSFKSSGEINKFPPRLLPYKQETVQVEGYEEPLPLFEVTFEDGSRQILAQVRRVGLESQMVDPANPGEIIKVHIDQRQPVEQVYFGLENYIEGVKSFDFGRYLWNSIVVTVVATALTLLVNSMAAFSLSKYRYRGREAIFLVMISTLMIPLSVVMVPVFLVVTRVGWTNNLLGVIVPAAATPTGVFLLRQYMLTIPDELIDAARIDGASEWRIYSQVVVPLAKPAMAVLTIFSVMWRWNDFLWPLIVLSRSEYFTLQVGLASFQGELNVQWNLILAMTVLTLLPISLVFAFLQRHITTGIATTGMK